MNGVEVLSEAFGRVPGIIHRAVEGAGVDALHYRVDSEANTITWLVWHLSRVQDKRASMLLGVEELWASDEWSGRFGFPFPPDATGFDHTSDEVAAARVESPELLLGYYDAGHERLMSYLAGADEAALEQAVDDNRPGHSTTAGALLVRVAAELFQHAGQVSLVRGFADRAS